MNNINRDYLVKVDTRNAKITPSPKELKFFMTDVWTSNIFFELEPKESISELIDKNAPHQNANYYKLTLRVVKPNGEPKTIEVTELENYNFHVADLTTDFVDIPGVYQCELFIDAEITGEDNILRLERNTTDPFEYRVEPSIFYNLDDIIDTKILAIEDIATVDDVNNLKDYVDSLAVGGVSLEGYATTEQLNTKADEEHVHDEYITQTVLDEVIAGIDCANIDLENFVASNSISINRKENSVIGQYSTAEGYNTAATGDYSHAEGNSTIASSNGSHAEGHRTTASNYYSHAEGSNTTADGYASHAEGYHTIAKSSYQHVQGRYNIEDTNDYAHIVGNGTSDARSNAHTLDWNGNGWFLGDVFVGGDSQYFNSKKLATEDYVNESVDNINIGNYVTERAFNNALSDKSDKNHTHDQYATTNYVDEVIQGNINMDGYVTDEEFDTKADKEHTHDEYVTQTELDEAIGNIDSDDLVVGNSISMGRKADTNIGSSSTALGYEVTASGNFSHATGNSVTASGNFSHAEGSLTTASGVASHAEGGSTKATGQNSHAEGSGTTASNYYSHAEGQGTAAGGICSHAEGYYTIASSGNQHVQGKYNIEDKANTYAHIVGNGTSTSKRSNAHTLDWSGNAWFAGNVTVGADNQVLATQEDVNNVIYDDTEVRGLIENKADEEHTHDEYATTSYVDNKIWIGTKAEYHAIVDKNPNILYLIQENEV